MKGQVETLSLDVPDGTPLWEAARALGLPVASACSGSALCGRCGLEPLDGGGALSPETETERLAKENGRIEPALRLSCQARVHGEVTATARYW